MLGRVRACQHQLHDASAGTGGGVPPALAGDGQRVHAVCDHGQAKPQVVLRHRIGGDVAAGAIAEPFSPQGMFDAVYAQVDGPQRPAQAAGQGRLSGTRQAGQADQKARRHGVRWVTGTATSLRRSGGRVQGGS